MFPGEEGATESFLPRHRAHLDFVCNWRADEKN